MMARFFPAPADEDDLYDSLNRQAALRARSRAAATPALAGTIAANARTRQLPAGATYALAATGNGPSSPVTQLAGQANAKRKSKKKGLGWNTIGDVVTGAADVVSNAADFVTPEAAENAVGAGLRAATPVAKGIARAGFTVAAAPLQELQGLARAGIATLAGEGGLGENLRRAGGSTLRLGLGDALSGKRPDLGSGFLPGGALAKEQEALARRLEVNGQWISVGRTFADVITEPGTKPYTLVSGLLDAGIAIAGDPASKIGKVAAAGRAASKTFAVPEAAGLVAGRRKTTLPEVVNEWLGGDGRQVVAYLAQTSDPVDIWRKTNKKVPIDVAARLADAPDEAAVLNILRPELGTSIREKFDVGGVGVSVRRAFSGVRLLQQMPGHHVDLDDLDDVAEGVERFMRNAKVDSALIDDRLRDVARADNRIARYDAVSEALADVTRHLAGNTPASSVNARRMTTMFRDYSEEMAKYFVDEVGNNVPVLGAVVDGVDRVLPTPHLFNEYINRALPLPDARAIRRVTSRYGRALNQPAVSAGVAFLDWAAQDVWKPLVLLRGAWTVRVVGEEQVRMGASGLSSMFRHPLSAIAFVSGHKGATSLTGETFDDAVTEFAAAMSTRGGAWRDRRVVMGRKIVDRSDPDEYVKAWADELLQLENDAVAKRVAGGFTEGDRVPGGLTGNHVDDAKRWFWEGPGRGVREQIGRAPGREALIVDKAVADAYIDTVWDRVRIKTGDDSELLDIVAFGRVAGEPVRKNTKATDTFRRYLGVVMDEGVGPGSVKGDWAIAAPRTALGEAGAALDKAVESMFTFLMSKRTNQLSRSPAFKQYYWQRAHGLFIVGSLGL